MRAAFGPHRSAPIAHRPSGAAALRWRGCPPAFALHHTAGGLGPGSTTLSVPAWFAGPGHLCLSGLASGSGRDPRLVPCGADALAVRPGPARGRQDPLARIPGDSFGPPSPSGRRTFRCGASRGRPSSGPSTKAGSRPSAPPLRSFSGSWRRPGHERRADEEGRRPPCGSPRLPARPRPRS